MKKRFILFIFFTGFFCSLFGGYLILATRYFPFRNIKTELKTFDNEPVLTIYHPDSTRLLPDVDSIQHFELILNGDDEWELDNLSLLTEIESQNPILLTIELWDTQVLLNMQNGIYDEKFKHLFTKVSNNKKELYLRWNPEMEMENSGLPWGNRGSAYADAFKKFSTLCREYLPNSKIVWGPAGYTGLMENYPGPNYIDLASITLDDELKEQELSPEMIKKQLKKKLHRMRFVEVPILILGSSITDSEKIEENSILTVCNDVQHEKKEINFRNIYPVKAGDSALTRNDLHLGVFDPNKLLINEQEISVEHIFINFGHIDKGTYISELKEIFGRNHNVIITVEPNYINKSTKEERTILQSILTGGFDDLFSRFYKNLPPTDQTIYLRFAHEMEIPIERYSWQSQDPVEYIKAYRYFMQFPGKESIPNLKKVWGPAGDRGLLEFWPGEDVVDVISIAIYGLPDKNITDPNEQESFEKIYNRKKRRIDLLNKPLFITEFGVKGDAEFQDQWLIDAAKVINAEPNIIGVSYFNREDVPEAWGNIQPPQWQISKKTFKKFTKELK